MAGFSNFMKMYVKPEVYPLIAATCFAIGIAGYRLGLASVQPEVQLMLQEADHERFKKVMQGESTTSSSSSPFSK